MNANERELILKDEVHQIVGKEYIADFLCYDQIFPLDRSSLSARPDSNGGATPIRRGTANERQFGHCRSLAFIRVHSRFMRTAVSLSPEP